MELLMLYANGISDEQLQEIKCLLGKYSTDKATEGIDNFIAEKGLTPEQIVAQSKEHHRHANRG